MDFKCVLIDEQNCFVLGSMYISIFFLSMNTVHKN
jgi:hypothetical protein